MVKRLFQTTILSLTLILALLTINTKQVETQSTLPWGVSFNSISSATTTTTGTSYALISNPAAFITATVDITGTVTSQTILLEGSLDNSTWFTLASTTSTTDTILNVTTAVKFIRARISAHGGGGGTTTVDLVAKGNFWTAASLFSGGSITGDVNLTNNATLSFNNDNIFTRVADGHINYSGVSNTTPRVSFGGTTSAFPALKRNGILIEARLADDSTGTSIRASGMDNLGSFFVGGSLRRWQASASVTITSGFGTSPTIVTNGTYGIEVTVGTGGVDSSGIIGLSTAIVGWNCHVFNQTTTSATVFMTKQTASTTTSATLTNYDNAGVAQPWVAGDKLRINCFGY